MKLNTVRTYSDTLLEDKHFREKFEREYKNLVISEKKIASACGEIIGQPGNVSLDRGFQREWQNIRRLRV